MVPGECARRPAGLCGLGSTRAGVCSHAASDNSQPNAADQVRAIDSASVPSERGSRHGLFHAHGLRARLLVLSAMRFSPSPSPRRRRAPRFRRASPRRRSRPGSPRRRRWPSRPTAGCSSPSRAARLRVIKNGALLATPFVTVTVNSAGERGLLGVALRPELRDQPVRLRLLHDRDAADPQPRQPLHRDRRRGALAGSEVVILDLENLSSATNHNGGAIHFGPDGKLYVAVGENANGANAQTLNNRLGKILRINPDGTIPTDNPFYNTATGANRAIWALGPAQPVHLRVPARHRPDVHQRRRPEHLGGDQRRHRRLELRLAGHRRADRPIPRFRSPIFAYGHGSERDHGLRHHRRRLLQPADRAVPERVRRRLLLRRLLQRLDPQLDPANGNASRASRPASPARSTSRSRATAASTTWRAAPAGPSSASRYTGEPGARRSRRTRRARRSRPAASATFTVAASGTPPLAYQWQRNGVDIPGATSSSYTPHLGDDRRQRRPLPRPRDERVGLGRRATRRR